MLLRGGRFLKGYDFLFVFAQAGQFHQGIFRISAVHGLAVVATVVVSGSNQTTNLSYTGPGGSGTGNYLHVVTAPMTGATTTYSYDSVGRVLTTTDSESYTLTYAYDNLDRLTSTTYPDGTTDQTLYNNPAFPLDVAHTIDRQGRTTTNVYDAIRELIQTTDPLGRIVKYGWCTCGGLATLTDANNNTTTWNHDLQGRVTSKVYADGSQITYTFENTTSRLHSLLDANGNTSTYTYNVDNTLASTAYTSGTGVATTPGVSFGYDTPYNRVLTMTDGTGTTHYSYNPVNANLGAGRLGSVTVPIAGTGGSAVVGYTNSAGAVGYDELGRVTGRSISSNDTNSVSTTYDTLGRVTNTVPFSLSPAT